MNFGNQYSQQFNFASDLSPSHFAPLSIEPVTQPQSGSSQIWSPFSTPSFSPYNGQQTSPFQYSSYHSPNVSSRPISKANYFSPGFSRNSTNLTVGSPFRSRNFNQVNEESRKSSQPINYIPNQIENQEECNKRNLPKRSEQIDLSETIRQAAIQRALGGRTKVCTFCKTNGEREEIYTSHSLKDSNDKITCPILMRYSCPVCGASGEQTHTKKYCPQLQKKVRMEMLRKMTVSSEAPGSKLSN